jgi:FMN-dependent NADH-azoreductase
MMKILNIISSPVNGASSSTKLGNAIVAKLQEKYVDNTVTLRNIAQAPLPHLEEIQMTSFFTADEKRTPQQKDALKLSDKVVDEVMDADVIVINVPMYNFGIPSTLKTWLDHLIRKDITFQHSTSGIQGMVTGKKVYLAISSGGIYSEGPRKHLDYTENYLRSVLDFIGITDVTVFRIEAQSKPDLKEEYAAKAMKNVSI